MKLINKKLLLGLSAISSTGLIAATAVACSAADKQELVTKAQALNMITAEKNASQGMSLEINDKDGKVDLSFDEHKSKSINLLSPKVDEKVTVFAKAKTGTLTQNFSFALKDIVQNSTDNAVDTSSTIDPEIYLQKTNFTVSKPTTSTAADGTIKLKDEIVIPTGVELQWKKGASGTFVSYDKTAGITSENANFYFKLVVKTDNTETITLKEGATNELIINISDSTAVVKPVVPVIEDGKTLIDPSLFFKGITFDYAHPNSKEGYIKIATGKKLPLGTKLVYSVAGSAEKDFDVEKGITGITVGNIYTFRIVLTDAEAYKFIPYKNSTAKFTLYGKDHVDTDHNWGSFWDWLSGRIKDHVKEHDTTSHHDDSRSDWHDGDSWDGWW